MQESVCDLKTMLWNAPLLTTKLSDDWGFLAQFVWLLGPRVEAHALQVPVEIEGTDDWHLHCALLGRSMTFF